MDDNGVSMASEINKGMEMGFHYSRLFCATQIHVSVFVPFVS